MLNQQKTKKQTQKQIKDKTILEIIHWSKWKKERVGYSLKEIDEIFKEIRSWKKRLK